MIRNVSPLTALAVATLLLSVLFAHGEALADDSSAGVEPPRITFASNDLVTRIQRQIHLNGRQVQVVLVLARTKAKMRQQGKGSLPLFKWRGQGDPYPDRHYPELKIHLDGRAVGLKDGFRAETAKGDITEALRAAGIDPFLIADSPPIVEVDKLSPSQVEALQIVSALRKDPDAGDLAMWSAQREATFDLPSVRRTLLVVSFLARPAFELSATTDAALDPKLRAACTSTAKLRRLAADVLGGEFVVAEEYVFDVAASAAGARDATVSLDLRANVGAPRTLYATCGIGGASMAGVDRLSAAGVMGSDGLVRVVALSLPAMSSKR